MCARLAACALAVWPTAASTTDAGRARGPESQTFGTSRQPFAPLASRVPSSGVAETMDSTALRVHLALVNSTAAIPLVPSFAASLSSSSLHPPLDRRSEALPTMVDSVLPAARSASGHLHAAVASAGVKSRSRRPRQHGLGCALDFGARWWCWAAAAGGVIVSACLVFHAPRYCREPWTKIAQLSAWCSSLRSPARDKPLSSTLDNWIGMEDSNATIAGPLSGYPMGMSLKNEIPSPETLDSVYFDFSAPQ